MSVESLRLTDSSDGKTNARMTHAVSHDVVPQIASKVVLSTSGATGPDFRQWALGGSPEVCRPSLHHRRRSQSPAPTRCRQASGVSMVVRFLAAYNAGKLAAARAHFTNAPNFVRYVGVNDCNYKKRRIDGLRSRSAVGTWLRSRFVDRDRMTLAEIHAAYSTTGTGTTASDAAAVVRYARRTRTSLEQLGFPQGIAPRSRRRSDPRPAEPSA
jgi:hypothetical protein